ncbi:COG3014 family protein [Ferrimonas balearica]|uniref:COG3014 family protein n=1 Tax=Ferrimonas balearica TaxID=44012 RepID=UPI001C5934A1|nr:hypothetical protein [Ferrimonas balearica]MBW3165751.1 hypothetical protein [Ferrimonas balearica]
MPKRLMVMALVMVLAGCAGSSLFQPYPARMAPVKQALEQGNSQAALKQLEPGLSGSDALLYAQEAGRVAALGGDYAASQNYYREAMAEYSRYDWKALVSLSDITAQVGGSTVSDNLIPYHGQAYERVLVHQQQSLNYLWQGDLEGAMVEVRRADQAQTESLKAYQDALKSTRALENAAVDAELNELDRQAGKAPNSFINAYVLLSNAAIYEANGQPNDALIDIRKALQVYPDNRMLQRELVRLSCQLSIDCDALSRRYGDPVMPKPDQGRLVVLYETGFLPARSSVFIPFTWDGLYQQVSLPTYRAGGPEPAPLTLTVGTEHLTTEAVADLDAMAARALREQYPFILLRQGIRLTAKHNANRWAERKGGDLGAITMEVFNALTEQADKRSWLTLPRQAQAWAGFLDAGEYPVSVGSERTTLTLSPGRTTVLWVARQGGLTRIQSILI